ncbi:MAG: hypothetical protein ACJAQT_004781 [Akkermansiaceae bacterium]
MEVIASSGTDTSWKGPGEVDDEIGGITRPKVGYNCQCPRWLKVDPLEGNSAPEEMALQLLAIAWKQRERGRFLILI